MEMDPDSIPRLNLDHCEKPRLAPPPPVPDAVVHELYIEAMEGYIYIVEDPSTKQCAIIDPRVRHFEVPWEDYPEDIMVVCIDKNRLKPRWILETSEGSPLCSVMKRRLIGFTDEPELYSGHAGGFDLGRLRFECMHLAGRHVFRVNDCVFGFYSIAAMTFDKKALTVTEARKIYDARKVIMMMPNHTKIYKDPADRTKGSFTTVEQLKGDCYDKDFDTFFTTWNIDCITWPRKKKWWKRGVSRQRQMMQ